MKVVRYGKYAPPIATCAECDHEQFTQGATDIFRLELGGKATFLCERHLDELVAEISKARQ